MIAKVAVDCNTNVINDVYDYIIPQKLEEYVKVGSRVFVEFGFRKILGFVIDITPISSFSGRLREVVQVLDFNSELSLEQIAVAKKIASDTKSPLSKCLDAMLPTFLKSKFRQFISIKNKEFLDPHILTLFDNKRKIMLSTDLLSEYPKIKKEIEKGNLSLDYDILTYGKKKKTKIYSFNEACENLYPTFKGVKKSIIDYCKRKGVATIEELKEFIGCSTYIINELARQEILHTEEYDYIIKDKKQKELRNIDFDFEEKQIKTKYVEFSNKPFLLYSNDESFRLKLYLDICIDNILNKKKTMIVTPTLITCYNIFYYLRRYLEGYEVLMLSGDMPQGDYYENYMKSKNGDVDVLVTSKVGAFTPINDCATFIVCDESNYNYISEYTPKMNVVEALKERANFQNAKIILESSPLTIENYYNYFLAEYNLLSYVKPNETNVKLVNMYNEVLNNRQTISLDLENAIDKALRNKKQVMLILNSKGYSNVLKCMKCGSVAICEKCHIPLTYYKDKNEYKCKYCGKSLESIHCKCGGDDYSHFQFGLEKLKESLQLLYPFSNILLIDSNTLKEYDDYKNACVKIESGEVDIIIGTTNLMGFSRYANLDLIGLVSIDSMLNNNDYRASYNTFSLIYNACNLSGNNKNCNVIIQGYNLDHYSIKYGIKSDFNSFYNEELKFRKTFLYPPFLEINRIIITGEYKDIYYCANYLKKAYSTIFKTQDRVLGPVYVKLKKGVQLIIKNDNFDKLSLLIEEVRKKFSDKNVLISFERYPRSI